MTEWTRHFVWLVLQVWSAIAHFWQVSAGLAVAAVGACLLQRRTLRAAGVRSLRLMLSLFFAPLLILAIAVFLSYDSRDPHPAPFWRTELSYTLAVLTVGQLFFVIFCARGFRWTVFFVGLAALEWSFWALFVMLMSVTGDWL